MSLLAELFWIYMLGVLVVVGGAFAWLRMDRRRSPEAQLGAALWPELFWAFWMQPLMLVGLFFWPRVWQTRGESARYPTLLLHGYAQSSATFWPLAKRLRRRGRGQLYAMNYSLWSPNDVVAERLAERIEAICEETGAERVHIVAHSMGCMISRYYIERLSGAKRVRSLVSLGAPFEGTERARLNPSPATKQVRPGSEFLRLLGPPRAPSGVRYHAVWSHSDEIIVPARSGSLSGGGEEVVLRDCGHLGLLMSGRVAGVIGLWLDEAEEEEEEEEGEAFDAARVSA